MACCSKVMGYNFFPLGIHLTRFGRYCGEGYMIWYRIWEELVVSCFGQPGESLLVAMFIDLEEEDFFLHAAVTVGDGGEERVSEHGRRIGNGGGRCRRGFGKAAEWSLGRPNLRHQRIWLGTFKSD